MWRSCLRRALVLSASATLAPGAGVSPAAGGPAQRGPLRIRVPDSAGMAVKRALLAARLRLGVARCREVLDDFPAEPPLAFVLDELGRTPEEHLDRLVFQDGSRRAPCASPAILAFTHPRSDTVYVCASQFKRAVQNDPTHAEMILIHEMLHTLGLRENPPTSLEITARVTERCGEASTRHGAGPP
jgi:hypothetical protein